MCVLSLRATVFFSLRVTVCELDPHRTSRTERFCVEAAARCLLLHQTFGGSQLIKTDISYMYYWNHPYDLNNTFSHAEMTEVWLVFSLVSDHRTRCASALCHIRTEQSCRPVSEAAGFLHTVGWCLNQPLSDAAVITPQCRGLSGHLRGFSIWRVKNDKTQNEEKRCCWTSRICVAAEGEAAVRPSSFTLESVLLPSTSESSACTSSLAGFCTCSPNLWRFRDWSNSRTSKAQSATDFQMTVNAMREWIRTI